MTGGQNEQKRPCNASTTNRERERVAERNMSANSKDSF